MVVELLFEYEPCILTMWGMNPEHFRVCVQPHKPPGPPGRAGQQQQTKRHLDALVPLPLHGHQQAVRQQEPTHVAQPQPMRRQRQRLPSRSLQFPELPPGQLSRTTSAVSRPLGPASKEVLPSRPAPQAAAAHPSAAISVPAVPMKAEPPTLAAEGISGPADQDAQGATPAPPQAVDTAAEPTVQRNRPASSHKGGSWTEVFAPCSREQAVVLTATMATTTIVMPSETRRGGAGRSAGSPGQGTLD